MSALTSFIVVVLTWARKHVRVTCVEASTDISAHSICDVLLVHGVAVRVVSAGTWYIDSLGFNVGFETVCEFGYFTTSVFRICRVFKVKITQDLVSVRRG